MTGYRPSVQQTVLKLALLYPAALAGFLALSLLLQGNLALSLVAVQGWFLLLAFVFSRFGQDGVPQSRRLGFVPVRPFQLLLTALLALSLIPLIQLAGYYTAQLIPGFEAYLKNMSNMLQAGRQQTGFIGLAVLFALLPAFCEEVLFRGVMQQSLLRHGFNRTGSVVAVGILFGLFHLDPYRLLPTALLGMMMGAVASVTGSVWSAVVYHLINNTVVVVSYLLSTPETGLTPPAPLEFAAAAAGGCLAVPLWLKLKRISRSAA